MDSRRIERMLVMALVLLAGRLEGKVAWGSVPFNVDDTRFIVTCLGNRRHDPVPDSVRGEIVVVVANNPTTC